MFGIGIAEVLVVVAALGAGMLPFSVPPLGPDAGLDAAAPPECLFYTSWSGTAKADPGEKNPTAKLLAEPEVLDFVDQLTDAIEKALDKAAEGKPEVQLLADTGLSLANTVFSRPTAIYLAEVVPPGPTPPTFRAGLVVNTGPLRDKVAEDVGRLEGLLAGAVGEAGIQKVTIAGTELKRVKPDPTAPAFTWGFKDEYFVLTVGDEADTLLGRLAKQGAAPAWLQELRGQVPVDRPVATSYIDLTRIMKTVAPLIPDDRTRAILEKLGVNRLQNLSSAAGLNEAGVHSRTLLAVDGEPTGLLKLLPSKPIAQEQLKSVPRDATVAVIARLDPLEVYRTAMELTAAIDPHAAEQAEQGLAQGEQQLNLKLVDDLLEPLGDTWTLYTSSDAGSAMWGFVASVTIDDVSKFTTTHDRLLSLAQILIAQQRERDRPTIRESTIGDVKVHTLQLPVPVPFAPCWAIVKDRLVVALNLQVMKEVIGRDADDGSLADIPAVRQAVEKGASILSYQDTPALVQQLYGTVQLVGPVISGALAQQGIDFQLPPLPTLSKVKRHIRPTVGVMRKTSAGFLMEESGSMLTGANAAAVVPAAVGLAIPAVLGVRSKAATAMASNDLRQVAIALLNCAVTDGHLPDPAITDADGKPLLSWRVKLLPYLDQQSLYQQFHLDEPWDSPNNAALIAQMPDAYADPSEPALKATGKTRVVVPTGPAALFNGREGPSLDQIRDGTSQTIMVVQVPALQAVVWTKPDDLAVDPKNAQARLTGGGSILTAFADGSIRTLRATIDPETLRRLFDPRDGQAIDDSQF